MKAPGTHATLCGDLATLHSLGSAGSLTDGEVLEQFVSPGDPAAAEAAFRMLVERHSPMVLSVCRQRLNDPNDAEDAFQATFLLLVRKARSIRHHQALGGWLFVTARRVAARARSRAARRRRVESNAGMISRDADEAATPPPDGSWSSLYEEIERLPGVFRDPLVLHYFDGQTAESIARRLGCPRNTVLSRLARARKRLRHRLTRRGIELSILIGPGQSPSWLRDPFLPRPLIEATTRCAGWLLRGTGLPHGRPNFNTGTGPQRRAVAGV